MKMTPALAYLRDVVTLAKLVTAAGRPVDNKTLWLLVGRVAEKFEVCPWQLLDVAVAEGVGA